MDENDGLNHLGRGFERLTVNQTSLETAETTNECPTNRPSTAPAEIRSEFTTNQPPPKPMYEFVDDVYGEYGVCDGYDNPYNDLDDEDYCRKKSETEQLSRFIYHSTMLLSL